MGNELTVKIKTGIEAMTPQFKAMLPDNVPVDKFIQVVKTTILSDKNLLNKDQASLFKACLQFAEVGLYPNGRDGAIVAYGNVCNPMIMIGGLRKLAMQTGLIDSITSEMIYKNDIFKYSVKDSGVEFEHTPEYFGERGATIGVYCLIRLKDGGKHVEIMNMEEIDKIKACAKGGSVWSKFFSEMCIKSVTRRALKKLSLPDNNSRMNTAMELDNSNFEIEPTHEKIEEPKTVKNLADIL